VHLTATLYELAQTNVNVTLFHMINGFTHSPKQWHCTNESNRLSIKLLTVFGISLYMSLAACY